MFLLDRLALWMESRGWLYWRRSRGQHGSVGNAFLEVQKLLEPAQRHVLEERRERKTEHEARGGKPDPGRD